MSIRLISFLIPLAMVGGIFFANAQDVPVQSSVKSAVVYRNGAQLTREASVYLTQGTHTLVFENLTSRIDPSTIQVAGLGDMIILGVSSRNNFMVDRTIDEVYDILEDSLDRVNQKISYHQGLLQVYAEERKMILVNNQIKWDKTGFMIEDIEDLSDFYRQRLTNLLNLEIDLNSKNKKLQELKQKLMAQLNERKSKSQQPSTEVIVEVAANLKSTFKIELKYNVYDAGWSPMYELAANSTNNTLELKTKAQVYQSTGIDWNNIKLTLSTSAPRANNIKPTIYPWRLDFQQDVMLTGAYSNKQLRYNTMAAAADDAAGTPQMQAEGIANFTIVEEAYLNVNYNINLNYTIKGNGKPQNVHVKTDNVKSKFYHYTAPKLNTEVQLLAAVQEWESLNLMPAEVVVYLDNNYVGKSYINPNISTGSLEFVLGNDPSVVVSRTKIKDYSSSKAIGSNKEEQIGYAIKIKNTKNKAINLTIQDQVPISGNKDITVKIEGISEGKLDENTGIISWEKTLAPNAEMQLEIKYMVKYPKDSRINL